MKRIGLLGAVLLTVATASYAQGQTQKPAATFEDQWRRRIDQIRQVNTDRSQAKQDQIQEFILIQSNLKAFLLYAQSRGQSLDVRSLEDARTDKQVGSPGNSPGSGSVVSKGAVPAILGFAVENGALTQEVNDTTVTLRGNLVGWLDLIQNQGFIAAYQDDSRIVRQLRRVSYSATLNTGNSELTTAQGSTAGGVTPAALREQIRQTRQQLAGYSLRLAILDERDPRTPANRSAIATTLETTMADVLKSDDFLDDFLNSNAYTRKWVPETAALLNNPALNERGLERVLYSQLEALRLDMLGQIDHFDDRITRTLLALEGFNDARLKVFQAMQKRPLVALEYSTARTKDLPDTSAVRLIAEGQWGPRIDATANVAWTFQHEGSVMVPAQTTTKGTRDFQVAAQLDVPLMNAAKTLSSTGGIGTPVFGVAYLSEKLYERAAVAFAGNTFTAEPGWIHLVQARLTLPVKGSGVKVPLSISWANRSELLKEKTIRGQIGLTLDMDVLSALRK
jgi:hypothetical protein